MCIRDRIFAKCHHIIVAIKHTFEGSVQDFVAVQNFRIGRELWLHFRHQQSVLRTFAVQMRTVRILILLLKSGSVGAELVQRFVCNAFVLYQHFFAGFQNVFANRIDGGLQVSCHMIGERSIAQRIAYSPQIVYGLCNFVFDGLGKFTPSGFFLIVELCFRIGF